ncbi:MAG TPA: hypothetical protein VD710_06405 [Nitrososphaeraceae archaeon]|nr:hypothetical protein [Nitrososphaeraceae archaeon]
MPQRIKISIPPKYKSSGPNMEIEVEVDHVANLDSVIDRAIETMKRLESEEVQQVVPEKYERRKRETSGQELT